MMALRTLRKLEISQKSGKLPLLKIMKSGDALSIVGNVIE